MRLVQDLVFLETLEFRLSIHDAAQVRVAQSKEEVLRQAMVLVGLELIDYGSFTEEAVMLKGGINLCGPEMKAVYRVYSKAYRERAERAAGLR